MMLCSIGHVATTGQLLSLGLTRRQIDAAVRSGAFIRPRNGVVACPHLDRDELLAAQSGVRLDCITVLRSHGIWTGSHVGLHVRVARGDKEAHERIRRLRPQTAIHWRLPQGSGSSRLQTEVADALRQATRCLPIDDLIAAIESAVHLKKLAPDEALELIEQAPKRLRRALADVDTRFRAQSGYETIVRLRLTRLGYRVEPQARVPGVGRVDNLVEGCVAIETDGTSFHRDRIEDDHRRDLGTEGWGIRVLRIDPRLIDADWEWVQDVIVRMVEEALASRRAGSHRFE